MAEFPARPEFRQELAKIHNNRADLLRDSGRLKQAEQDYDQALTMLKQLAADFPSRPEFRQELARSHKSRGIVMQNAGRSRRLRKTTTRPCA